MIQIIFSSLECSAFAVMFISLQGFSIRQFGWRYTIFTWILVVVAVALTALTAMPLDIRKSE
jgi:hypothetical protein